MQYTYGCVIRKVPPVVHLSANRLKREFNLKIIHTMIEISKIQMANHQCLSTTRNFEQRQVKAHVPELPIVSYTPWKYLHVLPHLLCVLCTSHRYR